MGLASRGLREDDEGRMSRVGDPGLAAALRRKGLGIALRAALGAAVLAALSLAP